MDVAAQPRAIPIWPEGAPGSEDWSQQEVEGLLPAPWNIRAVRNVVRPTLTPYLPDADKATGTTVVVCPGGAFHFLAIAHEGTEVASWLVERGVAALVLRYRVARTAADGAEFATQMRETFADRPRLQERMGQIRPLAIADGRQAMKVARQRASGWGVAPDRIGVMGFSAGGTVATGVALQHDSDSRPAFAAPIYGAPWEEVAVPVDAPPLFLALAHDDDMAVRTSVPLYSAWKAAGRPAELHIFSRGGHGFGMNRQGLPSDRWIDLFGDWLRAEGFS